LTHTVHIFTDVDFMPSTVSDQPLASTGDPTATPVSVGKAHHKPRNDMPPATPGTSNSVQPVIVSPEDVHPFAKAASSQRQFEEEKIRQISRLY